MALRNWLRFFLAAVFVAVISFLISRERQSARNEETINHQEQQIEIQNEIFESKKQVQQRKAVARAISTNDNLEWLRKARCKDCAV